MTETAIQFTNVTKIYMFERESRIKTDILNPYKKHTSSAHFALDSVSFSVAPRETIGIIGSNGAGKTTILRLIAGITFPSFGSISINGKVAPLIELGAGFHSEFSGKENIYLNGTILGMSLKEIQSNYDSILRFAGGTVREFIDTPMKKYSLGMKARLGFSIAIHTKPDILLVDESLSVGDQEFQRKCIRKLKELKRKGITIIVVSHNIPFINSFCSRVLTIENGRLKQ